MQALAVSDVQLPIRLNGFFDRDNEINDYGDYDYGSVSSTGFFRATPADTASAPVSDFFAPEVFNDYGAALGGQEGIQEVSAEQLLAAQATGERQFGLVFAGVCLQRMDLITQTQAPGEHVLGLVFAGVHSVHIS